MARAKTPKKAVWRETLRKGQRVLVDPDGNIYRGTAQEVRDAALMPYRRDALARSLNLHRYCRNCGTFDAAEFAERCAASRRDAIHFGWADALIGVSVHIPAATYIKMLAGSRLVMGDGEKPEDYFRQLFESELEALLDVAQSETGKREIPMTRHERDALERLRGTPGK